MCHRHDSWTSTPLLIDLRFTDEVPSCVLIWCIEIDHDRETQCLDHMVSEPFLSGMSEWMSEFMSEKGVHGPLKSLSCGQFPAHQLAESSREEPGWRVHRCVKQLLAVNVQLLQTVEV